jgi:hypothetical protein
VVWRHLQQTQARVMSRHEEALAQVEMEQTNQLLSALKMQGLKQHQLIEM